MAQLLLLGQNFLISRFHDFAVTHVKLGMTPLDEWSARRRGLYLIHNNQKRQPSVPPTGIKPTSPASEMPQNHASLQTSQNFHGLKHVLKPTACNAPIACKIEARSCNHCWSGKSNYYYIFWVCVCSLSYPACNAHAPHCYLWPVRLFRIFPHCLKNGTILEISYWT